ncbi:nuclear transport factor 2 family protein [Actinophytocola sp.]|uniref:nuclear transport factor 2 family protein n=1 Tax=Actinophytocola sp. TaxID=1872138 RepID=UPI003899DB2A
MTRSTAEPTTADAAALARRFYDHVDDGNVPGLVAMFAPRASYHRPGYAPFEGQDGITEFYSGVRKIRSGRHTLTSVVATDDTIAVRGEFQGTLHDGSPVDLRFADFFELGPDRRFTRRDTFFFAPLA